MPLVFAITTLNWLTVRTRSFLRLQEEILFQVRVQLGECRRPALLHSQISRGIEPMGSQHGKRHGAGHPHVADAGIRFDFAILVLSSTGF
jgi:hypothetical protein